MKKLLLWSMLLLSITISGAISVSSNSMAETATDQRRQTLFANLADAQSEAEGRKAENAIWEYWLDQAPSLKARGLIEAGMKRREAYDFAGAEEIFDQAVQLAPNYSEAWNQRAFARFLRENFEGAQNDLERALELEPQHFGSMSGLYHILRQSGREKAAFSILRQAVVLHPWLKERGALPTDMVPEHIPKQKT